jgi:hypothetical protein
MLAFAAIAPHPCNVRRNVTDLLPDPEERP